MRFRRSALAGAAVVAALVGSAAPGIAWAGGTGGTATPGPILTKSTVTQAAIDQCFQSIGGGSPTPANDGTCPSGYQPKINGGYVWAATRSGNDAWFGTTANAICQGGGAMVPNPTAALVPNQSVCEYGQGAGAAQYGPNLGDVRLPQVLKVNADTQQVQDLSPVSDPNFQKINGLRAAGADNNVVLMFGLKLASASDPSTGLGIFAFDATTGKFLGSQMRPDLISARETVKDANGNMYLAARQRNADGSVDGVVLRWTGDESNPFSFETVGVMPNDAGYITTFGNRLVVSGWPSMNFAKAAAAVGGGDPRIWMSPEIPAGGSLTSADAGNWSSIFDWKQYDPDPVVGNAIAWGAAQEWNGALYVGSYNYAAIGSAGTLWNTYGKPADEATRLRDAEQANRPATIFRITDPGTPQQKVTLLYGSATLPVYDGTSKTWSNKPNLLGQAPLFGAAGFGNPANEYSWTFTTFQNHLYMATFNAAGALTAGAPATQAVMGLDNTTEQGLQNVVGPALYNTIGGGEVWRMDDPSKPAVAETLDGFGDRSQHGVRVFLPFDDKGVLFAGMGGAYNLKTGSTNRGGWSIDALRPGASRLPLTLPVPANGIQGIFGGLVAGE